MKPNTILKNADDVYINTSIGFIVQPDSKDEAKIAFKEKLYDGVSWIVEEIEFQVIKVESYKVSEFPIGQKVIIQRLNVVSGNKRFIPQIDRD